MFFALVYRSTIGVDIPDATMASRGRARGMQCCNPE